MPGCLACSSIDRCTISYTKFNEPDRTEAGRPLNADSNTSSSTGATPPPPATECKSMQQRNELVNSDKERLSYPQKNVGEERLPSPPILYNSCSLWCMDKFISCWLDWIQVYPGSAVVVALVYCPANQGIIPKIDSLNLFHDPRMHKIVCYAVVGLTSSCAVLCCPVCGLSWSAQCVTGGLYAKLEWW